MAPPFSMSILDVDIFKLFHFLTKDRTDGGRVSIPHDSRLWPDNWRKIEYKAYPRLPHILLPMVQPTEKGIFDVISKRRSEKDLTQYPISKVDLSILLKFSCGLQRSNFRAQPSGGARYPIEIYPIVFFSHELETGIYHYDVLRHALVLLDKKDFSLPATRTPFTPYEWAANASVLFVMTAVFDRTTRKYGPRGYRYILVEAGHIGQNLYLVSQALGLKCCGLGGADEILIEKTLGIDGNAESALYVLTVGK